MKLIRNFKTKKQLREENERLKFMLHRPQPINFVEREVQKISFKMIMTEDVPMEAIKRRVKIGIADNLEPFIEWDIEDVPNEYSYQKQVKANVYLAKRK
jgi:hypothetical protein